MVLGIWVVLERLGELFLYWIGEADSFDDFGDKMYAFGIGFLLSVLVVLGIAILYLIGTKVILPVFE